MLEAIRKRAQGIFAWFLLIAIGVPFALWGIQNYIETGKERPAAVVGDREIFDRDVTRAYEQSLASLVGIADYDQEQLRDQALERLINDEVINQAIFNQSLTVSDNEVRSLIQAMPYFQTDGRFDKDRYKAMLSSQGMNSAEFAERMRQSLIKEQFKKGILNTTFITDDQFNTLLRLKNQQRQVEYVTIQEPPGSQDFAESEIANYYRNHLDEFRIPEQVSIDYVEISLDQLASTIQLSEDELKQLYQEQKGRFETPERRRLSHILVALEGEGSEADTSALEKAKHIRERLVQGEDFSKLARENSDDPTSGKKGGDLGFIDRESMEEPFSEAASALEKPGDLSDPVRTSFGYHLILLTEKVPAEIKPFETVREELRKTAQHNKAENQYYEVGQKLSELAFEHPDTLEPIVSQLALTMQSTPLFTHEAGEGIAQDEAVRKAAFSEEVLKGRNSDPIEMGPDRAIVARIREHKPASEKPLDRVRDQIVQLLREEDARKRAAQKAEKVVKEVNGGTPLAEAAQSLELPYHPPAFILRENEKLPSEFVVALFKAPRPPANQPHVGSIALSDGSEIVFGLITVKDGELKGEDSKEAESGREFLSRSEAQSQLLTVVERMRELTDITINEAR